jgi:lipopolysaccharide biosynthesis glycosyltransferase
MNLITVFNYPDEEKYNTMFKIWLLQAIKTKSQTPGINQIKILTENGINEKLTAFVDLLKCDYVVIERKQRVRLTNVPHRWLHNVGFKLFNLCQEVEPFIFLDADAILMTDANDVIRASKDKPFISADHQTIPRHTDKFGFRFMNTGFFVVSDTTFLDFIKIIRTPFTFKCPGTDQFLLNNYCRSINYDYTHQDIHYGWNSCGGYKKVVDGEIFSHNIPEKHKIHVLHYWDVFKPWITPCPIYNKLESDYKLFESILPQIQFNNIEKVLEIYTDSNPGVCLYTQDREIYNYLEKINTRGENILVEGGSVPNKIDGMMITEL